MGEQLTLALVQAARERLRGVAHQTPVLTSRMLDRRVGRQVFLKCENFQRGGAFKFRGAYNALYQLSPEERRRGVLAFSSGNHAQGVALAAQVLGIPAVICMPQDAPAVKVAATREYGADVVFFDRFTEDREAFAQRIAAERGLAIVPPFDDVRVMAGAGTVALELWDAFPDLDAVITPIGGGGLIAGTAVVTHGIRAGARVFGAEPEDGNDTLRSLHAGERVRIPTPTTIADGLRATMPGRLTFPIVQQHVTDIVLVSDAEVLAAIRFALLRLKIVIEPSGAVPLAAVFAGRLPEDVRRVGVVISGGNIDPTLFCTLWSSSG